MINIDTIKHHRYSQIFKIFVSTLLLGLTTISCSSDVNSAFDDAYVHIMQNDLSMIEVNSNRRDVVSYSIYFSPGRVEEELLVDYTITVGDGLTEGEDYEILTSENPMSFPPGIYERPIQIRWLDNPVDITEDNTLKIKLSSVNLDVNIGLPGPDNNQSEFIIEKVNN